MIDPSESPTMMMMMMMVDYILLFILRWPIRKWKVVSMNKYLRDSISIYIHIDKEGEIETRWDLYILL